MQLHREPNPEELAEAMQLPLSQVDELLRAANQPISLEQTVEEDGERELGETLPDEEGPDPEEELALSSLKKHLHEALEELPPRERRTLELRHGLTDGRIYTLEEVGHQLGVTRERARQLEAQAFRRLRHPSHRHRLLGYLREPEG